MQTIRVLHISDFHFGCPDPHHVAERIADDLLRTARGHFGAGGPDLCVATGDIAFSGAESEYRRATQWFRELLVGWSCRLFVIPGNHDIARPDAGALPKLHRSRAYLAKTTKEFPVDPTEIDPFALNLDGFKRWHREDLPELGLEVVSEWNTDIRGCAGRFTLSAREEDYPEFSQSVSIVGVNSALFSFDDNDQQQLIVDLGFLNRELRGANPTEDLVVVAMHHPVTSGNRRKDRWLAGWNNQAVERCLLQSTGPQLFLHGHLHKASGESRSMINGQYLTTLAAGAAYQHETYPISFGCYELHTLENKIDATVYSWDGDAGLFKKDERQSDTIHAILPNPLGREAPQALSTSIRALAPKVRTGNSVIDEVIAKHSRDYCGYLESIKRRQIVVDTHVLYRQILQAMAWTGADDNADTTIDILDQDVHRWNELIDQSDQIAYNTFNYSQDILEKTKAIARLMPRYKVRRVFVLSEEARDFDEVAAERVSRIFNAIEGYLYRSNQHTNGTSLEKQIQNRFVVAERANPKTRAALEAAGDVVVVSRSIRGRPESTLFREELTFDSRKRANETKSFISADPGEVEGVRASFSQTWSKSTPISQFEGAV